MPSQRIIRVNELIKREIASLIYRLNSEHDIDLSCITVTQVITAPDLRKARVFVSVTGGAEQEKNVIRFLLNQRKNLQRELSNNVTLKYTPHLNFSLDPSLHSGDQVLTLLDQLPPLADSDEPKETPDV